MDLSCSKRGADRIWISKVRAHHRIQFQKLHGLWELLNNIQASNKLATVPKRPLMLSTLAAWIFTTTTEVSDLLNPGIALLSKCSVTYKGIPDSQIVIQTMATQFSQAQRCKCQVENQDFRVLEWTPRCCTQIPPVIRETFMPKLVTDNSRQQRWLEEQSMEEYLWQLAESINSRVKDFMQEVEQEQIMDMEEWHHGTIILERRISLLIRLLRIFSTQYQTSIMTLTTLAFPSTNTALSKPTAFTAKQHMCRLRSRRWVLRVYRALTTSHRSSNQSRSQSYVRPLRVIRQRPSVQIANCWSRQEIWIMPLLHEKK